MSVASRKEPGSGSFVLPTAVTLMLVALVWVYHVGSIPTGGINRYDEFYTLDRSASFARQGDWLSVYSRNEVTFKKPPLQYWMSALLLEGGIEQAVALRLPSMLFALGTLLSTALLAAAIVPQYPWSMPLSVLLGASSNQFWRNATSAMLDSGTAFFATLALATAILALRRPVWWYAVAVAIGLGALQKAPVGLLLVALYILFLSLTRTRHGFSYKELKRQPQFRRSLLIAIIATLAWPVLQTLMHGTGALDEFFREQMVRRFAPEPFEELRRLATLEELIIFGEPYLRWSGILALFWLPWRLGRPDLLPLPAIFFVYLVGMYLAGGNVYPRYTLIYLPMLNVALAAVVLTLVPWRWLGIAIVAAASTAGGGPFKGPAVLRLERSDETSMEIEALQHLSKALAPDETLVYCNWDMSTRLPPGAVSYYASNGRPFFELRTPNHLERYASKEGLSGPLAGICSPDDLDAISARLDKLEIVEPSGDYLIWKAKDIR